VPKRDGKYLLKESGDLCSTCQVNIISPNDRSFNAKYELGNVDNRSPEIPIFEEEEID
jgi:hypothetical protein